MRRWITALVLTGAVILSGGCAATDVPVVGSMTPTPTETPTPSNSPTPTPTETPIAIITTTPEAAAVTPIPVSLTPIVDADDYLKTIGVKAEGESVFRVKLVNNTGKAIKSFRVISTLASYYKEESNYVNLLTEGDLFADKEERILYYDTIKDPSNDAEEKHYNLRLIFEDGSVYEIPDVPFSDMEDGIIHSRDLIPYITYISKATSNQTDTADGALLYTEAGNENNGYEQEDTSYDEDRPNDDEDHSYDDEDRSYDEDEDQDRYNNDDYDEE